MTRPAHLRIEERNLHPPDELRQRRGEPRPACGRAQHDQRAIRANHQFSRAVERDAGRDRQIDRMRRDRRHVGRRCVGDVFRQFEMDRTRPFELRDAERFAHHRRNGRGADNLIGHLGQRRHGRDNVDHLKAGLLAAQNSLLPGDHHHRHGAEQRISRAGRQVERAGAERGYADAWSAGEAPVGRGHESRRLLVPGQDQPDLRASQRFDHVEIFLARNPEDLLHALILERGDQEFCAVHPICSLPPPANRGSHLRRLRRSRSSKRRAQRVRCSATPDSR